MRWGWLPREPDIWTTRIFMPTTYPPLPPHSSSRDGSLEVEFSGGQWLHQSCLFSEISIKNKKQQQQKENRVSENFQVVKQLEELGGWCTWEGHESFLLLLIYLAPCISVPELYVLVTWSCLTLFNLMDCNQPDSVHGIFQARILEWVAISFSRKLSKARIKPRSPALQADSLPSEHELYCIIINL